MTRKIWIPLLAVLLQTTGWGASAQANTQIIEARGSVEIRRGSQRFWGGVGTDLEYGDLLRPAREARIIVLCANNAQWRVPSGHLSGLGNGCPMSNVRSLRGRGEDDFLAFLTQQFVYETQFLNSSPLLRWEPSPHQARYEIRILQGEQILWQQQSDRPELPYNGPALQPQVDYRMEVFTVPPTATPIATLTFQILTPAQTTTVQTEASALAQTLIPEARAIALTRIYRAAGIPSNLSDRLRPGLVMEAIATLEPFIANGNQSAYLNRLLGDLYLQAGWLNQAEAQYQDALDTSTTGENTPERAAAQVGLANIRAAQGKLSDAATWLRLAQFNYALVGRGDRTELIEQWLARIALLQ